MNIVFFGTDEFAADILKSLLQEKLYNIGLVVTRPDRPVGRSQALTAPLVKSAAIANGIPVEQPESLAKFDIGNAHYDLNIVAQYGLLIPPRLLNIPRYGTLNVHTSLLPKYRGASPVQAAMLAGEKETGVTIMRMDEGLDTGPILLQKKIAIGGDDTSETLERKLAGIGAVALNEAIEGYVSGAISPKEQDSSLATVCGKLTRQDGKIDWSKGAEHICNQWRALGSWPGVWTQWRGKRLKILSLKPSSERARAGFVYVKNGTLYIGAGDGSLQVDFLQLEGKKQMLSADFLHGYSDFIGADLII